jgi:hypothetical protein
LAGNILWRKNLVGIPSDEICPPKFILGENFTSLPPVLHFQDILLIHPENGSQTKSMPQEGRDLIVHPNYYFVKLVLIYS